MKQKVTKALKFLESVTLIALFVCVVGAIYSWQTKPTPPKTYTVSLSIEDWRSVLQVIDTTSKLLNESDLPVRKVIFANQGLASVNQAIQFQVSRQLQDEAKKDSINNGKPKSK